MCPLPPPSGPYSGIYSPSSPFTPSSPFPPSNPYTLSYNSNSSNNPLSSSMYIPPIPPLRPVPPPMAPPVQTPYVPSRTPTPPPRMYNDTQDQEPELLILCHQKKMAYAPGELMQTYDAAIDYIKQAFPSLADTKRADIALYVDTEMELVRVPAPAWSTVFPTLVPTYGTTGRYVFVEVDGLPSSLPAYPFFRSIRQWFEPPPPPPFPWLPAARTYTAPSIVPSSPSTESLTARPTPEAPPPPFSSAPPPQTQVRPSVVSVPAPAPAKKRSFWSRIFGSGKTKGEPVQAAAASGEKGGKA